MRTIVVENYEEMSLRAADIVKSQIILKPTTILGCATGQTPLGLYQALAKAYDKQEADFSEVTFFNVDEYCKLDKKNVHSYSYYMKENFFKHINASRNNIFIPDSMAQDMDKECKLYDKKIREYGGIDLQILGIGGNGHIGFNEPGDFFEPETHVVQLQERTINANSRFFASKEEVPVSAVTMGIASIMQARILLLLASGEGKAEAVHKMIKGKITPQVPASVMQLHPNVIFVIDKNAAALL